MLDMLEFLRDEGVSADITAEIEKFRDAYPEEDETLRRRVPDPRYLYYGKDIWEEAITAIENALNAGGYEGKYIVQTYGTSELGGKLLAEGTNLEADLVTMSTFYLRAPRSRTTCSCPWTLR